MNINPRQSYHQFIEDFVSFVVPKNKKLFSLGSGDSEVWPDKITSCGLGKYDYVLATDILGLVDDVEDFIRSLAGVIADDGRVVITQYSALWEPALRLASLLGWRHAVRLEQNWLSPQDLRNFCYLAGLEIVKSGTKMLLPLDIPIVSPFFNRFLANLFPFSRWGLFHYVVARKPHRVNLRSRPSLSIIVPARNESGTIEKIARELPELGRFTEIIFIEGNSSDDTYAEIVRVAKSLGGTRKILFAQQAGRGKGDAVRLGFDLSTGDILTIYDADMTVPAKDVTKFYNAIVENRGDFINGSRLVYPLEKESMRLLNFFANKFFGLTFSWLLGQPLKDTLCGTKMLWRQDYEDIKNNRSFFGDFDPFGDFDLLFGAAKLNLKIVDLPIHYKQRTYGSTNISRWRHGWLLLKMTLFAARKIKFI